MLTIGRGKPGQANLARVLVGCSAGCLDYRGGGTIIKLNLSNNPPSPILSMARKKLNPILIL